MSDSSDFRYIQGTIGTSPGPDGKPKGCPIGIGPPLATEKVFYAIYNPAYSASQNRLLASYLQQAISKLNQLVGRKVGIYGGILPLPQNGYDSTYCTNHRLTVFVIEDLPNNIQGYSIACGPNRYVQVTIQATGQT